MKKIKKMVCLAASLALVASIAGCSSSNSKDTSDTSDTNNTTTEETTDTSSKPYIAVISKGFQHQFWQVVKKVQKMQLRNLMLILLLKVQHLKVILMIK